MMMILAGPIPEISAYLVARYIGLKVSKEEVTV